MSKKLLFRLFALVAAMMCALGASAAEAYANYTPTDAKLTFYYDNLRSSRTGTTYDLNTGSVPWYQDHTNESVMQVEFDSSFADARPTSTRSWFTNMSNLISVSGMQYFNTSEVTNMGYMFYNCNQLTTLDLSHFNTAQVTDMAYMFYQCYGLTSLDLSSFNTAKVTNMQGVFYNCSGLTSLNLSQLNTAKVTNMREMFFGCSSLTDLDLGSFNTSKVTNMGWMFDGCTQLTRIYVGSEWSAVATSTSNYMFYDCSRLVGGQGTTYDANHIDKAYAHIDGGPSNPGYFTEKPKEAYACYTSDNTTLTFYYDNQRANRSGTTYDLNSEDALPQWYNDRTYESVTRVVFNPSFGEALPTSTCAWFMSMEHLQSITGLSYLNTSKVTHMTNMFYGCMLLTSLDLSGFNTAKVTDMSSMFYGCYVLQNPDLSGFNTANVTSMRHMFDCCHNITSLDLSHFNTANVTNMEWMFNGCIGLTSLDLGSFNTAKVTTMASMFRYCSSLTNLNVTGFNTQNVTDMQEMFCNCYIVTSLDLHSFNTARVTNMHWMFIRCGNLNQIYVGNNWSTAAVTNSEAMFYGCTNLVGDKGTTYDENHLDKAYAHIDGGPSNPGYLSAKKEAYACYTRSNLTLTFYYDNLRYSREGTTYDLNEGYNEPGWVEDEEMFCAISIVVFDPSFANARPTSTYSWFYEQYYIMSITGLREYLNTSEVTNMAYMFFHCGDEFLKSIDLSGFNTEKVTDMSCMFSYTKLTSLDLSSFNTSKVTNMEGMFSRPYDLTTIYVGKDWNVDAVTSSNYMFEDCDNLVGGMGTTYDANHLDKEYAHIDGGPANPGYFTATPEPEAYACYTPSNTTLTFYYDKMRSSREGTTYDLNTGENDPGWYSDAIYMYATRVVFDPSFADARPTSTYNWFGRMQHITSISGMKNYLNTSEVTNMGYMFYYCTILEIIDVSGFNTAKVTNMKYMFFYCHVLHYLNLSNFNTARVTNMESMFTGCNELSSLNLSSFNTANVTDMDYMFQGCNELSNLNMKNLNTSRVTSMSRMFEGCSSLTRLDLSSFNTSKVTVMFQMFRGCSELTTIYVGNGWNTTAVYSSNNMFLDCLKIEGSQGTTYDANHLDKIYARIDGGTALPGYLSEVKESYAVYTPDNTTLTFYYDSQRSSRPGTSYNLYDIPNDAGWYTDGSYESVTQVVFDPSFADARPMSTFCWFSGMGLLQAISGMEYLNTSEVTSMYAMFYCCSRLTSLDLSHFNTAKVTDMDYMFGLCPGLTSLDLSSFNTARVTTMKGMFTGCSYLTTIYAGDEWSTVEVTTSTSMFKNCIHLVGSQGTTYDADHTDAAYAHIDGGPSNPGYFTEWKEAYACYTPSNTTLTFYYDSQRSSRTGTTYDLNTDGNNPDWYDVKNFVTQVVLDPSFTDAYPTTTYGWFMSMPNLFSITGMEYLNTDSVTNMAMMFMDCSKLSSLDLSHFNTSSVTNMSLMFENCRGLTSLDVSHFNTSNVTDMSLMFENCHGLTSLDLSSFNTDNVTTMDCMFAYSTGLTSVDLSSFTNARVSRTSNMFEGCSALTTIYASSSWYLPSNNYSWAMFMDCTSLVGGMGTTYDEDHSDGSYAHIDGGPSNPGYFSEKGGAFLRGDVNGDGSVNISDVTALINYLLSSNASGIDLSAADCSQDSLVNISDVTALINYLLSGSWN